ncbi:MAG: glucosaminidase domain-containing protein [Thermodesulfobacteriota bacterium]
MNGSADDSGATMQPTASGNDQGWKARVLFYLVAGIPVAMLAAAPRVWLDLPQRVALVCHPTIADGGAFATGSPLLEPVPAPVLKANTAEELVDLLKAYDLWEVLEQERDPLQVLFAAYPPNLASLEDGRIRKRVFFHTLLPAALATLDEVAGERQVLRGILERLGSPPPETVRFGEQAPWRERLRPWETAFLAELVAKYNTDQAAELLLRVDVVPPSLILGQGALESDWGRSKLALSHHNPFGMMVGSRAASFGSIPEAVSEFVHLLNSHPAYRRFRQIRAKSRDPLVLATGLAGYSQRGAEYVQDVRRLIAGNRLQAYDRFTPRGQASLPDERAT